MEKEIYAELNHNPYLPLTAVTFNGHEPRINCRVEKYKSQSLKDWVYLVPEIFYEEMNGYDFILNFYGTEADFNEVCRAFEKCGAKERVKIYHKNKLEDAETKSTEVADLIAWLDENKNRRLDFAAFRDEHTDLLDGDYQYIIIGDNISAKLDSVSVESVASVRERQIGALKNTPILFVITGDNEKQFREELTALLARRDIQMEQLFFIIHPMLDAEKVTRVISDLGVADPQIVTSADDDKIRAFLRNYPITDYIREVYNLLRIEAQRISTLLDEEKRKYAVTNADVHGKIESLENEISACINANRSFVEVDNYIASSGFDGKLKWFDNQIVSWKTSKTKLVGDSEALQAAGEYEEYLSRQLSKFGEGIRACVSSEVDRIRAVFGAQYRSCGVDPEYCSDAAVPEEIPLFELPELIEEWLQLKEITFVEKKTDLHNIFSKNNGSGNMGQTQTITYFLNSWRRNAQDKIMFLAREYVDKVIASIERYYQELAGVYHLHLSELISVKTEEKEKESMKLSGEEKILQADNDWLALFTEKLEHIGRD